MIPINFSNIPMPTPVPIPTMVPQPSQSIGSRIFSPHFSKPTILVPQLGMVTSSYMWGKPPVVHDQLGGNVSSIMSQASHNSLFGGAPPTNNFTGGASLPGGNTPTSTLSHTSYPPYVGSTVQSVPSSILGYNPINTHALGGPFLSGGTYLEGQHPFTSHLGSQ